MVLAIPVLAVRHLVAPILVTMAPKQEVLTTGKLSIRIVQGVHNVTEVLVPANLLSSVLVVDLNLLQLLAILPVLVVIRIWVRSAP